MSIQRTAHPAPGRPVPEAPLSRDQTPTRKGDSGCFAGGCRGLWGLNWGRAGSSGWKTLQPHRQGSTAGSWAPRRPGRGRTARRRSTPPGPGTAGTSLGESAGRHLPEPQNLPTGPPIRGHSTRPAQGTRGGLPHALHTLTLPHRFPAPGAGPHLAGRAGRAPWAAAPSCCPPARSGPSWPWTGPGSAGSRPVPRCSGTRLPAGASWTLGDTTDPA